MSRTRRARAPNSWLSSAGRPNSLINVAPGAENRSVICVVIAESRFAASRCIDARRRPIRRAGIRKIGSSPIASTVTCHDSVSITIRVRISAMMFVTTPEIVSENARCAAITSLLSRETSAPVRVRVKNAIGIRCTWSKTDCRSRRIRSSPTRDDCQRSASENPASSTATPAIATASHTTSPRSRPPTIWSTTRPASTGEATASTAATELVASSA